MMFLLFGASGSGKTTALGGVRERVPGLVVHDFDEIGVPSDADTAWRQRANEIWAQRALELQADGRDLLLAGQSPLGEMLAAPSAPALEGISACLLDCGDEARVRRIDSRGGGHLAAQLAWAAWMRRHARDPRWMPEVIRRDGAAEMRWDRWETWNEGDPRWRVHVIDTTELSIDRLVDELAAWIERREGRPAPALP